MADWRSATRRIHLAATAGMLLLLAPLMNAEGATKMLIVTSDFGSVMRCQTVGELEIMVRPHRPGKVDR